MAIAGFGYFAYQYINPSGQLLVTYDFCQDETPYFSGLSPHGRVLDIDEQGCHQRMVIDQVYFDVRLPQSYRMVEIKINAEILNEQPLAIGVGIDPDNWQWEFAEIIDDNVYLADLNQARFDNNRYRFIISTPGLDVSGQEILFHSLGLNFTKEPPNSITWKRLFNFLIK